MPACYGNIGFTKLTVTIIVIGFHIIEDFDILFVKKKWRWEVLEKPKQKGTSCLWNQRPTAEIYHPIEWQNVTGNRLGSSYYKHWPNCTIIPNVFQ